MPNVCVWYRRALLEEVGVSATTRYSKIKDSLRGDKRYRAVASADREEVFKLYQADLKVGTPDERHIQTAGEAAFIAASLCDCAMLHVSHSAALAPLLDISAACQHAFSAAAQRMRTAVAPLY